MVLHPILFPTFKKWYQSLSHVLITTPTPIRIALFPTLLIVAALPFALAATFTNTSALPKAYTPPPTTLSPEVDHPTLTTSTDNHAPQLITTTLPLGIRRELYLTSVLASDPDLSDTLAISVMGLPAGLALESCRHSQTLNQQRVISCSIGGTPTAPADIYPVTLKVTDSQNALAELTLPLEIKR